MKKLGKRKRSGPGPDVQNSLPVFNPRASDNLVRSSLSTTPPGRNPSSLSVAGAVRTDGSQHHDNLPLTLPSSSNALGKKPCGWNAFKLALNVVKESTSTFPSLQNAVRKLLKALDTIQEAPNDEDQFTSMAERLFALSKVLKEFEGREDDQIIRDRLESLTRSIERRVVFIEKKISDGNLQRAFDTSNDAKEIITSLREMTFVVQLFDIDTTMNTEVLTKKGRRAHSVANNGVGIPTWAIDVSKTNGNGDASSAQIDSFGYNKSPLEQLDELWTRLRPLSPRGNATWRSEMRDWSKYITKGTFIDGGAYGEVYTGTWDNVPGLKASALPNVVLKVMRPNLGNSLNQGLRKKHDKKVRRELEVWMKLRHPNIVPFIGVAYDLTEGGGSTTCPIMISLRMENGDLKKYLSQNQTCAKETFPLQIARGLAYLHQFNPEIVHGDLKAKNVLVDGDGILKLGDFGLSRMLSDESLWDTTGKEARGTVRWMSPELFTSQPTVTKRSDVYAFAMTVFEIFSNQVPFVQYMNDGQVITAVLVRNERPRRPHAIKDWIWDIMKDCWSFEPSQRLKIEEIIERLESGSQSDIQS